VLATVRRAKTEAKQSQRASVATLTVTVPTADRSALEAARADLVDALTVVELDLVDGTELGAEIQLG
jgi:valyl-tRNA synthetase